MGGIWINTYLIGDSINIMKTFPDNYFDIVFTSPPFKDEDVSNDYWTWYDSFFKEAMRVTNKVLIIIHSATKINEHVLRYPSKRILIWGKGLVKYSWRYNPIYVYQKTEDYKVNKYIWSDTFGVSPVVGSKKCHVYQDPLLLYSTIIGMFKNCNNVLDPCAGSGTTGKAAIVNNLDCTMIENNIEYEVLLRKQCSYEMPNLYNY